MCNMRQIKFMIDNSQSFDMMVSPVETGLLCSQSLIFFEAVSQLFINMLLFKIVTRSNNLWH